MDDDFSERLLDEVGVAGVPVLSVQAGSAADRAGLRGARVTADETIIVGDIIVAANGRAVAKASELIDQLEQYNIGDRAELKINRNGIEQAVSTALGASRAD